MKKSKTRAALVIILFIGIALFGCNDNPNDLNNLNNPNNPNNPSDPNNSVANWLIRNSKEYTVTDGNAGSISAEYNYNWIKYTNDSNYECVMDYNNILDTVQVTETSSYTSTQTQEGYYQYSNHYKKNGNIYNSVINTNQDITTTQEVNYVSDLIQNTSTTTRIVQEIESDSTTTYDSVSGLTSSLTSISSSTRTINNEDPTYSTSNSEYSFTIDLLDESNGVKTFKSYYNRLISYGIEVDINSNAAYQNYTIYKINNNGITLETINYNAAGNVTSSTVNSNISNGIALISTTYNAEGYITSIVERVFPANNTIRTIFPSYTLNTTTNHSTGSVTSQTVEVISESSSSLIIRQKTFTNDVLTGQKDEEYQKI